MVSHKSTKLVMGIFLAAILGSCEEGSPPTRISRQDELRTRYRLEPRRPLPLSQLAVLARRDSASLDDLCDLAGGLMLAREFASAIEVYRRALERFPEGPRAHFNLGLVYARTGQYEPAIRHWERTVELVPDFADAYFHLGVAHAQRAPTAVDQPANLSYADLDRAIEYCGKAVELEPGNAVFHYNLGRALQLRHLSDGAVAAYERALERDGHLVDAHRFLGDILLEKGDLPKALAAYQSVVSLDSTDAEGFYRLGKILERQEIYERAVAAYERAAALKPRYRDVFYSLARLYPRVGQTEAGQRSLARFEELEEQGEDELYTARMQAQRMPSRVFERRALAVAYAEAGRFKEAEDEFKVALALAPDDAAIYHDLGLLYDRMGVPEKAIGALEQAASMAPDSARFHLRLGQVYAKGGQDQLAEATFKRALEKRSDWGKARCELGMLYVRGRQSDKAQPLFLETLEQNPEEETRARFGLSLTYIDQARYREAAQQLEKLLEQDPAFPRGRELLDRVRGKLNGKDR